MLNLLDSEWDNGNDSDGKEKIQGIDDIACQEKSGSDISSSCGDDERLPNAGDRVSDQVFINLLLLM